MLTLVLFVAFIAAWLALYILVIRPKLTTFRYTAGIYARLNAAELGLWTRLVLILKGAKVAIIGLVTSSAPVAGMFYEQVRGLDWSQFLPSEKAKVAAGVVVVAGIVGPMIMVALHQGALAEAAAIEPTKG